MPEIRIGVWVPVQSIRSTVESDSGDVWPSTVATPVPSRRSSAVTTTRTDGAPEPSSARDEEGEERVGGILLGRALVVSDALNECCVALAGEGGATASGRRRAVEEVGDDGRRLRVEQP